MKILFFSQFASGHNVEYLHHYYEMAIQESGHTFFFVVPEKFKTFSRSLNWPAAKNIVIDYIPITSEEKFLSTTSLIKRSLLLSCLLKKYVKKYKPDKVMLTVLMTFMPFLPFVVRKRNLLSGILYSIYFYQEKPSLSKRLEDRLKYFLFSKMPSFDKLFILNDKDSSDKLCDIYNTKRFVLLPDPYVPITSSIDIRKEYSIKQSDVLFIHIGDLTSRKGTIDILDSIRGLSNDCRHYVFFFAGRVNEDIREDFYNNIKQFSDEGHQIYVKDEFCTFDFLGSLCSACDAILIPYHSTSQSSGILGYASQFGKPVIAPNNGLIGKLVKEYSLGVLIESITTPELIRAYKIVDNDNIRLQTANNYCEINSVDSFKGTLLNKWIYS